jgi:AbrB family looped-hinge helix DNA binding protein
MNKTFTLPISSQGQVTIPAKARRALGLTGRVVLEVSDGQAVIRREPSLEDVRAALGEPANQPSPLSPREEYLSEVATKKYISKR